LATRACFGTMTSDPERQCLRKHASWCGDALSRPRSRQDVDLVTVAPAVARWSTPWCDASVAK
jgi:hypothetical protein